MQEGGEHLMFNTVIDQVKAVRGDTEVQVVKLGEVTALSGGKAKVKLYGDSDASNKLYNYIDGYLPVVGDKVALLPQARTYIIIGKVTDATPAQKWAAIDHNHDGVYLPVANKDKITDDTDTLTLGSHALLPQANNVIALGSSSKQLAASYFKALYVDGDEVKGDRIAVKNGLNTYTLIATNSGGITTLTPESDEKWNLGTSSKKMNEIHLKKLYGAWYSGNNTDRRIEWDSYNALHPDTNNSVNLGTANLKFKDFFTNRIVNGRWTYNDGLNVAGVEWENSSNLIPSSTNTISLGTSSKQYNKIYGKEIYLNGTAITTSDRNLKKDIVPLSERYEEFFKLLNPVGFKYKDGNSGRTHTGFIAQEVEEAAKEAGLEEKDIAVVVKDQEGNYYLRYEEIIAVQAKVIQKMQSKVDELENRIARLESLIERSTR